MRAHSSRRTRRRRRRRCGRHQGSAKSAKASALAAAPTEKAILFAADGMRPDLVDRHAGQGFLPTMQALMRDGVKGQNGLLQGFPQHRVGWYTLSTGAWPGEHGSTNNTFHRTGEGNFNNSTSFATTGILQADHIGQAAERAGKSVVSVEWVGSRISFRPSRARSSTSAASSPAGDRPQLRPARTAGRRQRIRRRLPAGQPPAGRGLEQRSRLVQPGAAAAVHADDDLRGGEPDEGLRPLHLRLDERLDDELRPRARRPRNGRQGRQRSRGRSRPG